MAGRNSVDCLGSLWASALPALWSQSRPQCTAAGEPWRSKGNKLKIRISRERQRRVWRSSETVRNSYMRKPQIFADAILISGSRNKSLREKIISTCSGCLGNSPLSASSHLVPVAVAGLPVHGSDLVTGCPRGRGGRVHHPTTVRRWTGCSRTGQLRLLDNMGMTQKPFEASVSISFISKYLTNPLMNVRYRKRVSNWSMSLS